MKYKAVIFDLDGTLYDNRALPLLVILHSRGRLALLKAERISRRELAGRYFGQNGETLAELMKLTADKSGYAVEDVEKWYNGTYLPLQAELLGKGFRTKKGIVRTLGKLKSEGVKLACCSDYGGIREKLEALKINPELFDIIIDSPSAGGCKPCPEALLHLASMLGEQPQDILVVGDRKDNDGQAAAGAGMEFLLVSKSNHKQIKL
ncbi:MAG: HAD family hydrolase [Bacteroidales bacterium]|nr:HAD family hydrolase [Bacteroidales bacterium]